MVNVSLVKLPVTARTAANDKEENGQAITDCIVLNIL
jgi:hypothetical protein